MASNTSPGNPARFSVEHPEPGNLQISKTLERLVRSLASLKFTVALFLMSIFIVLVGTFDQVNKDILDVTHECFRVRMTDLFTPEFPWVHPGELFTRVDFQVFFPPAFFPSHPVVPGHIYFPKGWLIGALMAINLLAAHGLRFKIQARGGRLGLGLGVLVLGSLITALVILSGSDKEEIQDVSSFDWLSIWKYFRFGVALVWVPMVLGLSGAVSGWIDLGISRRTGHWLFGAGTLIIGGLLGWLIFQGTPDSSSMRILWQLIKAEFASLVLLAGCVLVFRKRCGIVLLHAGIGLMMLSEFIVGTWAVETRMQIDEGDTAKYAFSVDYTELAIADRSTPTEDRVVVIPDSILRRSVRSGSIVEDPDNLLPFDVKGIKYMKNSDVPRFRRQEKTPATAGTGLELTVDEKEPVVGTDTDSAQNMPAAYVEFFKKGTGESLGTYLLTWFLGYIDVQPEEVRLDGKVYDVFLRYKRVYKPYGVTLIDTRREDYPGTNKPKDYSSDIRLVDREKNVDRDNIHIWMNNPLRYGGETFYQSGHHVDPSTNVETSTLSVVSNTGWMIPYVSCMIVATGMLAQFLISLVRFLDRQSVTVLKSTAPAPSRPMQKTKARQMSNVTRVRGPVKDLSVEESHNSSTQSWADILAPLGLVLLCFGAIVSMAMPPQARFEEMNLFEFGKLPLLYEGRIKPFDTLARNNLMVIRSRQTYVDDNGKSQPAIRWLLDVITDSDAALKHKVFYIENPEVLDLLNLEPRQGFRYAIDEFSERIPALEKQLQRSADKSPKNMTIFERKQRDLARKIEAYIRLKTAFRPSPAAAIEKDGPLSNETRARLHLYLLKEIEKMKQEDLRGDRHEPPKVVPVDPAANLWESMAMANFQESLDTGFRGKKANPATLCLQAILDAYSRGDVHSFNRAVVKYQDFLLENPPSNLNATKLDVEASFNHAEPFFYSAIFYLVAFVVSALAWLGWNKTLNRAAFSLISFTLLVHTAALVARIYISGRPPVTNLYSSAVFIGWGCVVLGLILERVFQLGIGNVVASVAGFSTLFIAHILSRDGDTFVVLQAVLDTQFWLATHVVCITLGYATTYVAGILGVQAILGGIFSSKIQPSTTKDIARMTYGTVCFGIFFSFVGTVLGGLWADDSWGRFWGWDPKENGALIIVIWNALVLHARWGGMVKDRGLAVLATLGNIVVSWSWFGVNELSVGKHNYGFTEGALMVLGLFCGSQLLIAAAGAFLPRRMWASSKNDATA